MERSSADLSDLSLDQLVELERRADERVEADAAARSADGGDDDLLLPWWQRPFNIVVLVVTGALLAGMVGWMIGDSDDVPAHNEVDTGFLQDMRVHHEQAVLMSFVYRTRDDIDPGLGTIARSIIVGQSLEVGRMIQLLRSFGEPEANDTGTSMLWMGMVAEDNQMPGMASDDELDELARIDGRAADELFAELMIAHHLGGIEMADFAVANADNDEVIAMAASMSQGQRGEIAEMLGVLEASAGD
jgi:uncharacterized protein (DUF305 family)